MRILVLVLVHDRPFYYCVQIKMRRASEQSDVIRVVHFCLSRQCPIMNDETIANRIGCGTFGTVYAVSGGAKVIKIAHPNTDLNSLRREITMHTVQHPNIIRVLGCVQSTAIGMGIVMERGGVELFDILERAGALSHQRALDLTLDMLYGTSHLHERSIYHLDLKPENMLVSLDENGYETLKLCDFGLAHGDSAAWEYEGRNFGSLSSAHKYFGSKSYLPDVTLATEANFLRKRDQWAIGCILFAIAYGGMLYAIPRLDNPHYSALVQKLDTGAPTHFASLFGASPREVEPLLHQLISRNPMSCASILDDLQVTPYISPTS